jgi:hypothetical protein
MCGMVGCRPVSSCFVDSGNVLIIWPCWFHGQFGKEETTEASMELRPVDGFCRLWTWPQVHGRIIQEAAVADLFAMINAYSSRAFSRRVVTGDAVFFFYRYCVILTLVLFPAC